MDRAAKRELLAKFKKPIDMDFPVSGIVAEVVRPPLAGWLATGAVPRELFAQLAVATRAGEQAAAEAFEKMPDLLALAIKIAAASFKWPRIVEGGGEDEDTLDPATLPIPDLMKLLNWAMGDSADAPVETKEGATTVGELASFREDGILPPDGGGGEDVRQEPSH